MWCRCGAGSPHGDTHRRRPAAHPPYPGPSQRLAWPDAPQLSGWEVTRCGSWWPPHPGQLPGLSAAARGAGLPPPVLSAERRLLLGLQTAVSWGGCPWPPGPRAQVGGGWSRLLETPASSRGPGTPHLLTSLPQKACPLRPQACHLRPGPLQTDVCGSRGGCACRMAGPRPCLAQSPPTAPRGPLPQPPHPAGPPSSLPGTRAPH